MAKTVVSISLGSGSGAIFGPTTVYVRPSHEYVTGKTLILPAPGPIDLTNGAATVELDAGNVYEFIKSVPGGSYRGDYRFVPESDEVLAFPDLLKVSPPPSAGQQAPQWVLDVVAAPAAVAASAEAVATDRQQVADDRAVVEQIAADLEIVGDVVDGVVAQALSTPGSQSDTALTEKLASENTAVPKVNAFGQAFVIRPEGVEILAARREVDAVGVPMTVQEFSTDAHPIDLTGVVSSADAVQAFVDSLQSGQQGVLPPGRLLIDKEIIWRDKSISLRGSGTVLVKGGNRFILGAYGSYAWIRPVTAMVDVPAQPQLAGPAADIIEITYTGADVAGTLELGDVVKIVSDELCPEGRFSYSGVDGVTGEPLVDKSATAKQARMGGFFVVDSTGPGSKIKLRGSLANLDPFFKTGTNPDTGLPATVAESNVRIAKLNPHTTEIRDIVFSTPTGKILDYTSGIIRVTNMYLPSTAHLSIDRSPSSFVQFKSCFGYMVDDLDIGYASNDPGGSRLGYGVLDSSSAFGQTTRVRHSHGRHLWTDGTNQILANRTLVETFVEGEPFAIDGPDLFAHYGPSYGASVSDCLGIFMDSEVFSPHANGRNHSFRNCKAMHSKGGFSARGRFHTYLNIEADYCGTGWVAFSEDNTHTPAHSHVVQGATFRYCTQAIRVSVNAGGWWTGQRESRKNRLRDIVVIGAGSNSVYVENGDTSIVGMAIECAPTYIITGGQQSDALVFNRGAELSGTDWRLDFTRNVRGLTPLGAVVWDAATVGTGLIAVTLSGVTAALLVDAIAVTMGTAIMAARMAFFIVSPNTGELVMTQATFDYRAAAIASSDSYSKMSGSSLLGWRETLGTGRNSGWLAIDSANTRTDILGVAPDAEIMLVTSGSSAWTFPLIKGGAFEGQRITLFSQGSGGLTVRSGTATVSNNTVTLKPDTDRVLTQYDAVRLVWTGSLWRQIG